MISTYITGPLIKLEQIRWLNTLSWNIFFNNMPFNILSVIESHREINSLWPSDAVWRHGSGSTLAQVIACCLTAPSHYLNHYLFHTLPLPHYFKAPTCRASRQFAARDIGDSLEVIMALVAEVCGPEAEEHSHRATVATFILQKVCAVFGTHLCSCDIWAPPTDEFRRVVIIPTGHAILTSRFTTIVCLMAFGTDIIGISF